MKKLFPYVVSVLLLIPLFSSCVKEEIDYEESMLIGKWMRPSPQNDDTQKVFEYYRYDEGGTGVTWDTYDDVTEAEAQEFKWTLIKSKLTLTHKIETTDEYGVPKVYTIVELTTGMLTYKDDFGNTYSFSKVN